MSMRVGMMGAAVRGLLGGVLLAGALSVATLAVAPRAHAEGPTVSQAVIDKYNPAKEAYAKHDYAAALRFGKEALAAAKTPFEKQVCLTLVWGAAAGAQNWTEAIESGEALIAMEGVPAGTKLSTEKALATIYPRVNKIDKAIAMTKEYMKVTGGSAADWALLSNFYSAQKDCPNGMSALDKALAGGKQADEEQLKAQSFCANKEKNTAKRIAVNEELLKRFPKKDYYAQLLNIYETADPKTDPMALQQLLRFGFEHDYLVEDVDYTKLADYALDVGTTAEAQRILEKGFAKKILKASDKKATALLEQAKSRAADDKKTIDQLDAEARAGKNGEADVKVGYRYFSVGQYDKAVEAIQRGLQADRSGRLKRPDDASMVLGIAYLRLKKSADAAKAFTAAKADPRMAGVAKIWLNAT